MQVLVPYPDIKQSVQCMDDKTLLIQMNSALRLVEQHYPKSQVSVFWWNHSYFACDFGLRVILELQDRNKGFSEAFDRIHEVQLRCQDTGPPIWWGDMKIHNSHKSLLLYSNFTYYKEYHWKVQPSETTYFTQHTKKAILLHGKEYNTGVLEP